MVYLKLSHFHGFKPPCHILEATFAEDQEVNLGNFPSVALDTDFPAPMIKYPMAKEDGIYEVVMIDYERWKSERENWLIWHVASVTGELLKSGYDGSSSEIRSKTILSMQRINPLETFNFSQIRGAK